MFLRKTVCVYVWSIGCSKSCHSKEHCTGKLYRPLLCLSQWVITLPRRAKERTWLRPVTHRLNSSWLCDKITLEDTADLLGFLCLQLISISPILLSVLPRQTQDEPGVLFEPCSPLNSRPHRSLFEWHPAFSPAADRRVKSWLKSLKFGLEP